MKAITKMSRAELKSEVTDLVNRLRRADPDLSIKELLRLTALECELRRILKPK